MSCTAYSIPMSDNLKDIIKEQESGPQPAPWRWYLGDLLTKPIPPRDFTTAKLIVRKLREAGTHPNAKPITPSEHQRYTALLIKWMHRAEGLDPRFNVVGTRRGGLTAEQKARMTQLGWKSSHTPKRPSVVHPRGKCPTCKRLFPKTRANKKFCQDWCRGRYWFQVYKGATP